MCFLQLKPVKNFLKRREEEFEPCGPSQGSVFVWPYYCEDVSHSQECSSLVYSEDFKVSSSRRSSRHFALSERIGTQLEPTCLCCCGRQPCQMLRMRED